MPVLKKKSVDGKKKKTKKQARKELGGIPSLKGQKEEEKKMY